MPLLSKITEIGLKSIYAVRYVKELRLHGLDILVQPIGMVMHFTKATLSPSRVKQTINPFIEMIKAKPQLAALPAPNRRLHHEPETIEKCVSLKVLAEPPEGKPILCDIVFIHGLHGESEPIQR